MTLACLKLQPRADSRTEASYSSEIGSYVFGNMQLLEILDYCQHFDRLVFHT